MATGLFWERGYQSTSIGDLEDRTGLDRSSLYHAFGSKQAMFEEALRRYVDEFEDRLGTARRAGGGLDGVAGVFAETTRAFRSDPTGNARRCLMVNTVAELGSHDPVSSRLEAEYRDRLRQAFAAALRQAAERGQLEPDQIQPRGNLLASLVMGLFLTARSTRSTQRRCAMTSRARSAPGVLATNRISIDISKLPLQRSVDLRFVVFGEKKCHLCQNRLVAERDVLAFVNRAGEFYAREYRFPPVAGRLLAYLLICRPAEQTIDQLSAALMASRSAINGAVKLLAGYGAVRRSRSVGQRVDHVTIHPGALEVRGFAPEPYREQQEMAREALALVPDDDSERRQVIEEAAALYGFLADRMPVMLSEWQDLRQALRRARSQDDDTP